MRPLVLLFAMLVQLPAASPLFQSSFENSASGWTALRGKQFRTLKNISGKMLRLDAQKEYTQKSFRADLVHAKIDKLGRQFNAGLFGAVLIVCYVSVALKKSFIF